LSHFDPDRDGSYSLWERPPETLIIPLVGRFQTEDVSSPVILKKRKVIYHLYIIKCKDRSLYTGITTDVKRRFAEHKAGKGGHYTRSREVVKVLYTERHKTRNKALKREFEIKSWSREKKLALIK